MEGKGKHRRFKAALDAVADPSGSGPPAVSPPVMDPAMAPANNVRDNDRHADSTSSLSPSPPPRSSVKAPAPVAPVHQQQRHLQRQRQQQRHQQQHQHRHRQGVTGSGLGRKAGLPFADRVERLLVWAEGLPQGPGGLDPEDGNFYDDCSEEEDFPKVRSQVHQVHPMAQDDQGLAPILATPRGVRPAPFEDVSRQGYHPASNGRRGRPGFNVPGSHARDMAPSTSSRAYGSRAVPPRSTAFIR